MAGTSAVYNSAGTLQANSKIVIGRVTVPNAPPTTTVTVTLTGAAVFSSATSYQCNVTANPAGSAQITYTSGSSFTIGATNNGEVLSYICVGN